jgi:hypothetical protein
MPHTTSSTFLSPEAHRADTRGRGRWGGAGRRGGAGTGPVGEEGLHGEGIRHGNRLSEDKFWRRYNCVLLTGNKDFR